MGSQELGAWLRRQREARCWTRSDIAHRLIKAAHANGDRSMPDVDNLCHNIYRWERGICAPSERYKLYYCRVFGIPVSEFGVDKAQIEVPAGDLALAALDLIAGALGFRREFNGETLIIRTEKGEAGRFGNLDNALAGNAGNAGEPES